MLGNIVRRIAIIIVIVLMIITGGLWWVSKPSAKSDETVIYLVKVYEKSPNKVEDIKGVLDEQGLKYKVDKVKRTQEKVVGHRVVQHFEKKELAQPLADYLKGKKKQAVVKEGVGGYFIQVGGNFKDKKKADAKAREMTKLTTTRFIVEPNVKGFPYSTNEITVINLPDTQAAEALKEKLTPMAQEIEIQEETREILEETAPAEGSGEENKEEPAKKEGTKETKEDKESKETK